MADCWIDVPAAQRSRRAATPSKWTTGPYESAISPRNEFGGTRKIASVKAADDANEKIIEYIEKLRSIDEE